LNSVFGIFLVVAALAEQSHAAALQRHHEAPHESELTSALEEASRSKRSAQGYSLPDLSTSTPDEILDYIRRHYVLIKTNDGYILGRNTRKRASDGMKLLRRADNNFQLRVRKRGMPNSNFQLRVRKPFPSGGNNFQLRVRKSLFGNDYKRSNFQLRVRRPFNDNNFQLRVRKSYPSADNFQLRVRKSLYPLDRVAKAYPSGDSNFQLRVRKAMPSDNFQLRVRKSDSEEGGLDLDENEMEAYQSWLNQMIEDGRLPLGKRDYEEFGSDESDAEEENLNQGMK